jgi:hypothetical protein
MRVDPDAHASFAQDVFAAFTQSTAVTNASDVAEAVWRAVHDSSVQLRFPAGADAIALAGPEKQTRPLGYAKN